MLVDRYINISRPTIVSEKGKVAADIFIVDCRSYFCCFSNFNFDEMDFVIVL